MLAILTTALLVLLLTQAQARGLTLVHPRDAKMSASSLDRIDEAVRRAIERGKCPGAVVAIGREDALVYRKAWGFRSIVPKKEKATVQTMYDLASLTKVVATAPSIMILKERGALRLDDPVGDYFAAFKRGKRKAITIRHLLTHTSGLPAWENFGALNLKGAAAIVERICQTKLINEPGEAFVYSDLGFILLGEIVRLVSGQPLDVFAHANIYTPLGMKNTMFRPPRTLRKHIAVTTKRNGRWLRGVVHDHNAFLMGGVAGHAGLFSTVDDLAIFCSMILAGGRWEDARILDEKTVAEFTRVHCPAGRDRRGLGWDIDTGYSNTRGYLFPIGESFGHSGFTGTSLWLDRRSKVFVIFLSNRVHPNEKGDVIDLRREIATHAAHAIEGTLPAPSALKIGRVKTGLDVLVDQGFAPLAEKRVGLIVNASAVDRKGRWALDLFRETSKLEIRALFSPEHGLRAELDRPVESGFDEDLRVPIHSLYGAGRYAPTQEQLAGLDALVFDMQDVGVRFYTYAATMLHCMRAAAEVGIPFFVLDRPNPIRGDVVEGPVLAERKNALSAYTLYPVRHGMTVGEIATMENVEEGIGCDLRVIRMDGWDRRMWLDDTGLPWVNPSPNLRNVRQVVLYPCIGCMEGAGISVGRGTDTPFELVGAPWMDGVRLAEKLNGERIDGLRFMAATFVPREREFHGECCGGVHVLLEDRDAFRPVIAAAQVARAICELHGERFNLDGCAVHFGRQEIINAIRNKTSLTVAFRRCEKEINTFRKVRAKYLLYE